MKFFNKKKVPPSPKPKVCEHEYVILCEDSENYTRYDQVPIFCPKCQTERYISYYSAVREVEKCELRRAYLTDYKSQEDRIIELQEKVALLEAANSDDWSEF